MTDEEIKIYLPKYLSADSKNALLDALREFPDIDAEKFYTSKLADTSIYYQGDGVRGFIYMQLPETETKVVNALLLSNTCDMASENVRLFKNRVVYAPILKLELYEKVLNESGVSPEKIADHIASIKNQQITQIFYLPRYNDHVCESLVFFDQVLNISPDYFADSTDIQQRRIFSLSNFGHYLLLFKLSFHFCRFQDKIDRDVVV
jgi:hypothetical protein